MNKPLFTKITNISLINLTKISVASLLISPYTVFAVQTHSSNSTLTNSSIYSNFKISQNFSKPCQKNPYINDFFQALGVRETGSLNAPYNTPPNQYGFMGKYQFGEALLEAIGYYQKSPNSRENSWQGHWLEKSQVSNTTEFLNNKNNVQERAIRSAFSHNWNSIENQLRQRGRSLKNYLGRRIEDTIITPSGILAAAHVEGDQNVVKLLVEGRESFDQNGTSNLCYLKEFANYKVPRL